jgi:hypothetical protein
MIEYTSTPKCGCPGSPGYCPGSCPGLGFSKDATNDTIQYGSCGGFGTGFGILFLIILILLLFPAFFGGELYY